MFKRKHVGTTFLLLTVAALLSSCEKREEKFSQANSRVVNEVTFGGPSSSGGSSSNAVQQEYAAEAPLVQSSQNRAAKPSPSSPQRYSGPQKLGGSKKYDRGQLVPPPAMEGAPSEDLSASNPVGSKDYGVNPMTEVVDDALSTFSIDVDTGSYTLARRMLNSGELPPASAVRVEEFVNYFHYDYSFPDNGAFRVNLEAAPSPFKPADNRKIVRVGVQGKQLNRQSRKGVHLTFLVDVSGSMSGPDRMGLAKRSLRILTRKLGEQDTIAISTYAGSVQTILEPTRVLERDTITRAIDSIQSGGSTRMGDGLKLAYKTALKGFVSGDVNRVIVLSDGDANVGPQSSDEIYKSVRSYVEEGITLSTIGFGMGNYKDEMMEQLANRGNGNYFYIDSEREAQKVFGEQLDGTLQVIAKDVKIQVEFDRDSVRSYRLIGYENRDIADSDFRKDRVDAGEIGAGHSVTALYEIVLTDAATHRKSISNFATVRIRAKKPNGTRAAEQSFELTSKNLHPSLADTSESFQFATAVAGFAEVLRDSPYAENIDLALIEELAKSASTPEQKHRQEFIALVSKASHL